MIRFDILTLFPEIFAAPLDYSILKRARRQGLVEVMVHNLRDFAPGKHRVTDDEPYGGGGGMILKVEPIDRALASLVPDRGEAWVILLSPQGKRFDQQAARKLAARKRMVLICGHYEGVDERVRDYLADEEISIGDYILTGGEFSALVIVDAVTRLVPGALGNDAAAANDSFAAGLLEHPHYTRPASYRGWEVPGVLLAGHHREIDLWRRREALKRTWLRRPDLLESGLSDKDKEMLAEIRRDGKKTVKE
jgi:tRNA (guanine37-N1)-methyltransferase